MVEATLNLTATLGSAIIGGYVAFYSSRMQVEGNKKIRTIKRIKVGEERMYSRHK
ncbi:hypothetical protein RCO48_04410 [Peribacillus frigoritolerans]|nr:hypothetical protein [Peribacillus frigoritolerans]